MVEQDLFEALNACIDRVNAGESIGDCLRDYPQFAKRLRPLLETGGLVYHAQQVPDAEVSEVQQQVSSGLKQVLERKAAMERRERMKRRNWFIPLAAVASLVLVFAFAMAFMLPALNSPAAGNIFSNTVNNLDTTRLATFEVIVSATPIAEAITPAALPPTVGAGVGATVVAGIGTPTPEVEVGAGMGLTVTALPSGTPMPTVVNPVQLTATDLMEIFAPTPSAPPPTAAAIVPTSVARMSPVPATPGYVYTSTVSMLPQPTQVAALMTATTTPTGTATTTPTPAPTGTARPSMTPSNDLTVTAEAMGTYSPTMPPLTQPGLATPVQIIPLNAGEIDDNANWDRYLLYRRNYLQLYAQSVRDVEVSGRQIITVTDKQGLPVLGARVRVFAGQTLISETLTYATGKTLFFPKANPAAANSQSFLVMVDKGNAAGTFTLDLQRGTNWTVTLDEAPMDRQNLKLDVLFLLDATGSMADEISQLQNNLLGISSQIAALPANIDVRYGLVVYRDRGDQYVTQVYDFTPDVGTFQMHLNTVRADGGGDTPESLNEALHNAVQNVNWRGDDALKLVFLVADAAPHLDYPNDHDYRQEMIVAAQKGIKIHPIASSGLTPDGEFIFRQIAQYTMGHFLFLTYAQGASGAPGEVRPDLNVGTPSNPQQQQAGDYTVAQLDKLVLRLIKDELAAVNQRVTAEAVTTMLVIPPPSSNVAFRSTDVMPTPPPTPPPTATQSGISPISGVNVPFMLMVILLSVLIGYSLKRGAGYVEKRKHGEPG